MQSFVLNEASVTEAQHFINGNNLEHLCVKITDFSWTLHVM